MKQLIFALVLCCTSSVVYAEGEFIENPQDGLVQQRANYLFLMQQAYKQYPNLPQGILESLAYSASRWHHRVPKGSQVHDARPQSIGLFGLYDTDKFGFSNTLERVAHSQNIEKFVLINDVEQHIMATAGYISSQIEKKQLTGDNLANYKDIIEELSGINRTTQISEYARLSYTYDVMSIANKGMYRNGIEISPQPIKWHKIFSKSQLKQLNAPQVIIDSEVDEISTVQPDASKKKNKVQ